MARKRTGREKKRQGRGHKTTEEKRVLRASIYRERRKHALPHLRGATRREMAVLRRERKVPET